MGYALAIAAIGAGVSAYGTAQNASAVGDMAEFNLALANKFGKTWTGKAEDFIKQKEERLYNSGDIFERFQSTGAFGEDTEVLDNLRKAQSDFASLAAGDFAGFESQLDRIMKDNLVSTFGAGAPIGSYTDLSADAIMNLRRTGLSDAMQTTQFLDQISNNLLGIEFGIMDQGFNLAYQIDKDRVNAIMGYGMESAQTKGVGMQAAGNTISSIGSSLFTYGQLNSNNLTANAPRAGDPFSTPDAQGYYQPYGSAPSFYRPATSAPLSVIPTGYNPNWTPPNVSPSLPDGPSYIDGSVLPPPPSDLEISSDPAGTYYPPTDYTFRMARQPNGGYVFGFEDSMFANLVGPGLSIIRP